MEARAAQPPPPRFYKLYAGGADAGPPPPEAIAGGEFQQYGTSYSLGEQGGEGDAFSKYEHGHGMQPWDEMRV